MKTAVVTGASRGLGEAIAEALNADGWRVIGTSTSGKATDSVADMVQLNQEDSQSIKKAAEELAKRAGDGIDLLYNNAGFLGKKGSMVTDVQDALKVMKINILGVMDLTAQLLPSVNEGGLIINMSSGAGDIESVDGFNYGAYNVSKGALDFYTKSLAKMVEERDIKVIATDPQWVATDMGGSSAPKRPNEVGEEALRLVNSYDSLESGGKYVKAELKN